MKNAQKCTLPHFSREHLAGHLREPVVHARERAHHDAHDHVVHVRDDEVRVGEAEVDRRHGLEHAAQPADQEDEQHADREEHRAS